MPTTFVIDDSTSRADLFHPARGRGRLGPAGYAGMRSAEPFPDALVIPKAEWKDRALEIQGTRSGLTDRLLAEGVRPKDQQQTNFCWGNSLTFTIEILRAIQGQGYTPLSAASACCKITGFRNVGGYGQQAAEFIEASGLVPESLWPANAIDPRYDTPDNWEVAARYRETRWWALSTWAQIVTCLLLRIPVSVGLPWWGHQVTYTDAIWSEAEQDIDPEFWNSWGESWGDRGRAVLQGQRKFPSDAVAIVSAVAA